jgi:hypothetical protein
MAERERILGAGFIQAGPLTKLPGCPGAKGGHAKRDAALAEGGIDTFGYS